MQSKLVIASLAAMAHQTHAVNSFSKDQSSSDPASTLIGYYQNCQVKIDSLIGTTSTMGDQLKLTPSFNFVDIDENCPELTATVWMEPPAICETSDNCPQEGLTVVISPEDIKNGAWSHDFNMNTVAGEWYAHVTVSPYGFSCAMALDDGCIGFEVDGVCNAKVTGFTGSTRDNYPTTSGADPTYIYQDCEGLDHYYGPDGVTHTLNWAISELWNCNYCATATVSDSTGSSTASTTFDKDSLLTFSGDSNISNELRSWTSYEQWTYQLDIYDCDTLTPIPSSPVIGTSSPGPFPDCSVSCDVVLDDVTFGDNGANHTITSIVTESYVYTCPKLIPQWISTMNHDDWYSAPILDVTCGSQTIIDSVAADSYDMTWANLPIWVNSTVDISSSSDSTWSTQCSTPPGPPIWPECDVSMSDLTFSTTTVEGDDIDSHTLDIHSSFIGYIGESCPTFKAEVVYTRNDVQVQTMNVPSVINGVTNTKKGTTSFNDGKWCATATMTAEQTKPGEATITVESNKVCVDVVADACVLLPATSIGNLNGDVANSNYTLTLTADASYTMNVWCKATDLTYSWGWTEPTSSFTDFEADGHPYQALMAANSQVTISEENYETDMNLQVDFKVDYLSTTFTTQDDASATATDTFNHTTTCRPLFSTTNVPYIEELIVGSDYLSLIFSMETVSKSLASCVDLYALVEIFDDELTTDRLITNFTLDSTEIAAFQNVKTNTTVSNLPKENSCFVVKVTYGQKGKVSSQQVLSTSPVCWWALCQLSEPSITLLDTPESSADGNTFNWSFNTSVVGNEYCYTYDQKICITETTTGQTYCTDVDGQTATAHELMQTGNFGASKWSYTVEFKSDNSSSATANDTAYTFLYNKESCKFSFTSDLEAMSDTLNTVSIKQNTQVTAGLVCGTSTKQFVSNDLGNSTVSALESHTWNLESKTGDYCFSTWIVFSNFPQYPQKTADICQTWIQGCKVQVTALSMEFVAASANDDVQAQANINMAGVALGDCSDTNTTASMTGTDGSSYTFTVTDDFFTTDGQDVNQVISRSEDNYTVVVAIHAPLAQSIDSHQNMTTGAGFVNILDDSATLTGGNIPAVCDVVATSITWVSYAEVSDWQGPMIATYSGVVTAEDTCNSLSGDLKIKEDSSSAFYNTTGVTLVPSGDGTTYTWSQTIIGQNIYHYPVGKITVWDTSNAADTSSASTDEILWAPPCYLEINNFEKSGQIESADQLRTVLDYNIQIAHHGDKACNGTEATISLQNGDVDSFTMELSDSDLEVALSADGFNVSIQTEASEVDGATLNWEDPRAVANQTAPAAGFVTPTDYECSVQIFDFCLTDAMEVAAGRWAFNFTIRIEQNSQCGALSATMDLVEDGTGVFLQDVSLDGAAMIDSFNCDCDKTFTVEADYNGAAGQIYGQIDLRNGQQQIVQVMDSCLYDI